MSKLILSRMEKMPELPDIKGYFDGLADAPTLAKYVSLTKKPYTSFDAIKDTILGRQLVVDKDGNFSYEYYDDDSPAGQAAKEVRTKTMNTLNRILNTANNFLDQANTITSNYSSFVNLAGSIIDNFTPDFSSSTGNNNEPNSKDKQTSELFSTLRSLRERTAGRIETQYSTLKSKLKEELGEEGINSSYGRYQLAMINREERERLWDNDLDIVFNKSKSILDAQMQAIENQMKPKLLALDEQAKAISLVQQQQSLDMQDFATKAGIANEVQRTQIDKYFKENELIQRKEENINQYNINKQNTEYNNRVFDYNLRKDLYQGDFNKIVTAYDAEARRKEINNQARMAEHKANQPLWKKVLPVGVGAVANFGLGRLGTFLDTKIWQSQGMPVYRFK